MRSFGSAIGAGLQLGSLSRVRLKIWGVHGLFSIWLPSIFLSQRSDSYQSSGEAIGNRTEQDVRTKSGWVRSDSPVVFLKPNALFWE